MFPLLATPILLTFASLALLPVLLHFLRRFKKRRVEFAATMFLHSALAPRRRTNQLWRWILLLLRILVVLLVAFALARPQITQDAGQGDVDPDRPPRMHVLVIDATGSMRADLKTAEQPRARDQTLANQTLQTAIQLPGTHFASAIDAALQIVAQAPAGDTFQVLRVASRIEPMLPSASQKRDRVRDALESMKCGFGAADVAVALQMVNTNLVRPGSPSTLHLFTDGQRNQWAPQFIQQAMSAIPRNVEIQFHQHTPDASILVATENQTVGQTRIRSGAEGIEITNQVLSQTSGGVRTAMLPQRVGDALQYQEINSGRMIGTTNQGVFRPPAEARSGDQMLAVRLSAEKNQSDALSMDDLRYLAIRYRDTVRVAMIGSEPTVAVMKTILQSGTSGDTTDVFQIVEMDSSNPTLVAELPDVLMVCDARTINSEQAALLRRVRQNGGSFIWWMGESVDPTSYASLGLEEGLPVRPDAASPSDVYVIDPMRYRHPAVRGFRSYSDSGLLTMPIFRHWNVQPTGNAVTDRSSANKFRTALSLTSRETNATAPLMIGGIDDRGAMLVFTTAPRVPTLDRSMATPDLLGQSDPPWNAMVAWPSLVPLVFESLQYVAPSVRRLPSMTIGSTGDIRLPSWLLADGISKDLAGSTNVEGVGPLRERSATLSKQTTSVTGKPQSRQITLRAGDKSWSTSLGFLNEPGMYQLQVAGAGPLSTPTTIPISVNVPIDEGDLRRIDLRRSYNGLVRSDPTDAPSLASALESAKSAGNNRPGENPSAGQDLYVWFFGLAILMALAETLVARFAIRWEPANHA